jgi:N-acetylneuraminic acid mutarotase
MIAAPVPRTQEPAMRRLLPLPLLVAIALAAVVAVRFDNAQRAAATGPNTWTTVASMAVARDPASAVTLQDGRVFVASAAGFQGPISAEIYDPVADTWTAAATPASFNGAILVALLNDGRVLVSAYTAGDNVSPDLMPVRIYDPATNSWSSGPALPGPRGHIGGAVELVEGRIVVMGGDDHFKVPNANVWAYDPVQARWESLTPLPRARYAGFGGVAGGRIYYISGDFPKYSTVHRTTRHCARPATAT